MQMTAERLAETLSGIARQVEIGDSFEGSFRAVVVTPAKVASTVTVSVT